MTGILINVLILEVGAKLVIVETGPYDSVNNIF